MQDDDTDERDERTDEQAPPDPPTDFDDEPKSGTFRIPRI